MDSTNVLAMIMAGGRGDRLSPLTQERAKPAVPFAGSYRIIDFTLSNCVNSGFNNICVLTQYKSLSMDRHIDLLWKPLFHCDRGQKLQVIPPQSRVVEAWYRGTADAVYQNLYTIENESPKDVLVLAGDHIYSMDYRKMLRFHQAHQADVTVGAIEVPVQEAAGQFGVLQVDRDQKVVGFQEKPKAPLCIPGKPESAYASMGIYLFRAEFLIDALKRNSQQPGCGHDFGHHILPQMFTSARVFAFPHSSAFKRGG